MDTSLIVSLVLAFICLSRVEAAGRAFPIESENYITERFRRINSRLEWDNTNFLVDLSGHYADCGQLRNTGEIRDINRRTPEGDTISGFIDTVSGGAADVNAVNGYIRSLVDQWTSARTYNHMIRNARRFGCSIRPGCSRQAVVSCLFSPGSSREPDYILEEPEENEGEQHALAFTPQQYLVTERHTGNRWDRSHLLENLSGYETSCEMIGTDDWQFTKARRIAASRGIRISAVYGSAQNQGSTDLALDRILENFKQIQYARALGCSIIPNCMVEQQMYVVVSCIYQEE